MNWVIRPAILKREYLGDALYANLHISMLFVFLVENSDVKLFVALFQLCQKFWIRSKANCLL